MPLCEAQHTEEEEEESRTGELIMHNFNRSRLLNVMIKARAWLIYVIAIRWMPSQGLSHPEFISRLRRRRQRLITNDKTVSVRIRCFIVSNSSKNTCRISNAHSGQRLTCCCLFFAINRKLRRRRRRNLSVLREELYNVWNFIISGRNR